MPTAVDPFSGLWKLIAGTIAYTRVDDCTIRGTGKKNGEISLLETVSVTNRTLTLNYTVQEREREIARGVAVFEKEIRGGQHVSSSR